MKAKSHPQFPFLIIHEDGRVFSEKSNKFLTPIINHNGYHVLSIKPDGRNGNTVCLRYHRLVAECFIDNPENKLYVNHKDGNKQNNHVSNLEWCSASENMKHAFNTGLCKARKGEESTSAKLTEENVKYIRDNYKTRNNVFGARALGRKFGVHHTTIMSVVNNESWHNI